MKSVWQHFKIILSGVPLLFGVYFMVKSLGVLVEPDHAWMLGLGSLLLGWYHSFMWDRGEVDKAKSPLV